jgi:hypothetical protein
MTEPEKLVPEGGPGVEEKHENTVFKDGVENTTTNWDSEVDPTMWTTVTSDSNLGSFLARPVSIFTGTWEDNPFTEYLRPWELWADRTSITSKLSNFAYLRGNLKVRIVVNGSPFLYGKTIVGYQPLPDFSQTYKILKVNNTSTTTTKGQCWAAYFTPSIHGFFDASLEHSLEMELPMILPRDSIRLFSENTGNNTVDTNMDLHAMGELVISCMNLLRVANPEGASTPQVNYTIFAWMEDCQVYMPTRGVITPAMAGKSKSKRKPKKSNATRPGKGISMAVSAVNTIKDEYHETVSGDITVSGVASAIADIGDQLSSVPVIGPFAMAGSIAANGVAGIAKIFGWSMPTTQEQSSFVQQMVGPHLAATEGSYMGYKLSVDPKNCVTCDPRVMNAPTEDELCIAAMASRKSYFATFQWQKADQPSSNSMIIARIAVHPMMQYEYGIVVDSTTMKIPTPLSFASLPFNYWRGNITYTFQCVASKYHRGRVAIVYEPNIREQQTLSTSVPTDYNTNYIHVLDISELDGHSITIPWTTSRPALENFVSLRGQFNNAYIPNNASSALNLDTINLVPSCNGFFEIRVVNELQGPTPDPAPVEINVFAHCDDLSLWSPKNVSNTFLTNRAPIQPAMMASADNEPVTDMGYDNHTYMLPDNSKQQLSQVLFGERIASFRTLLKRFSVLGIVDESTFTAGSDTHYNVIMPPYPVFADYIGPSPPSAQVSFLERFDYFNYLRYAFVGMRGSYRYRFNTAYTDESLSSKLAALSYSESNPFYSGSYRSGGLDTEIVNVGTMTSAGNMPLAVEVPYYTSDRFKPASDRLGSWNYISLIPYDDIGFGSWGNNLVSFSYGSPTTVLTDGKVSASISSAAGDDFTFMYFVGCPPRFHIP